MLVADLMGESAGDLLLLMQKEAQKYINTPKLQELLRWADEVTAGSAGDVKPVGKRAIALANAIAIAYAIANVYAYAYANANANAIAYVYAYAIANAYAYVYAYAIANAYAIDRAINLTRELEQLKIFNNFNSTLLLDQLEALKSQVPDEKQPEEERLKFAESLQKSLLNAFNLTREKVHLSQDEISRLNSYLDANSLIIECKQAAVEVPSKTWEAIEGRMLLIDE